MLHKTIRRNHSSLFALSQAKGALSDKIIEAAQIAELATYEPEPEQSPIIRSFGPSKKQLKLEQQKGFITCKKSAQAKLRNTKEDLQPLPIIKEETENCPFVLDEVDLTGLNPDFKPDNDTSNQTSFMKCRRATYSQETQLDFRRPHTKPKKKINPPPLDVVDLTGLKPNFNSGNHTKPSK